MSNILQKVKKNIGWATLDLEEVSQEKRKGEQ